MTCRKAYKANGAPRLYDWRANTAVGFPTAFAQSEALITSNRADPRGQYNEDRYHAQAVNVGPIFDRPGFRRPDGPRAALDVSCLESFVFSGLAGRRRQQPLRMAWRQHQPPKVQRCPAIPNSRRRRTGQSNQISMPSLSPPKRGASIRTRTRAHFDTQGPAAIAQALISAVRRDRRSDQIGLCVVRNKYSRQRSISIAAAITL